ncbi:MAG: hypothetical protein INH41_17950 [Myxococcaceae bacterium]|nr:hypothetical protein [Myxococcaceae bacterium]
MGIGIVVGVLLAQSGCTKDTDCKGARVCEARVCVNTPPEAVPATVTPPPPPPPAPPSPPSPVATPTEVQVDEPTRRRPHVDDFPRVIRRDGLVCVQSLTDAGLPKEDCRRDERRRVRTPAPGTEPEPPLGRNEPEPPAAQARSTLVADFGGAGTLGLLLAGRGAVLPGFGLHGALGSRWSEFVGVMGVVDVTLGFVAGSTVIALTAAPALRLGDRTHATVALGPAVLAASGLIGNLAGLAGSLLVRGVFPISEGFGVHAQLGLTFDASGAVMSLALGVGGSVL